MNPEFGRRCRDRVFEFVDASLVAPAATMTPLDAGFAFDRFGVLSHCQVRGLNVADESNRGDSVADVSVCECCRLKFAASKITPALGSRSGGALSHGFAAYSRAMQQFDHGLVRPGSTSYEMLRLGYITEKSQPIPRFSSRIGQTACS